MSQVLFDNKNIEYGVRLLVACICGAIIGVERYKRSKGAGIRTHMLVALGAALFTIISKYGFEDVVGLENIQADAARVASNIVTGVSFLGAGLIFVRGDKVQGLTTAAGIWVTAAVGLTIGCGMYTTGFFCACFILMIQIILHHGFFTEMAAIRQMPVMDRFPQGFRHLWRCLQSRNVIRNNTPVIACGVWIFTINQFQKVENR